MALARFLACLVLGGLLAAGGVAEAQNLLVNGGGEADVGGDGYTNVPPSGWTVTAGAPTVTLYSAFGPTYFGTTDPGSAVRGSNYIAGGNGQVVSIMAQTIDVASESGAIDTGTTPYTLCGYLGGFANHDDGASVTVTFRDEASGVLGTGTIGPILAAHRESVTALCLFTGAGWVPAGTRTMVVEATFTRSSGDFNDGYLDELNLVLADSCPVSGGTCAITTTSTTSSTSTSSTSSTSTSTTSSSSTSSTTSSSTSTSAPPSTGGLPATTSSTTTPTAITTTTIQAGCDGVPTAESILCRLTALRDDVASASDLGALQSSLLAQATGARERMAAVAGASNRRKARALAKGAVRKLTAFVHRVGGRKGQKTIPSDTRTRLLEQADPLRLDVATFRKTL